MNQKNSGKPRKLSVVLMSLLLVVLIGANVGCGMYANVITQFFSVVDIDEAATGAAATTAREMTQRIAEEGIILLQNENNALPLNLSNEKESNINVFGWSSIAPIYGGGGSGAGDESKNVNLIQGLENAGFKVNPELHQFYQDLGYVRQMGASFGMFTYDFKLYEASIDTYTDTLKSGAQSYSDVAVIVIGRLGGEATDLPQDMSVWSGPADHHYLELSAEEDALIDMVAGMGFKKVVAVINSNNPMELGFLQNRGIDAAVLIGGAGQTGMNALGNVLSGAVNPSGRLVDTYAYEVESAPAFYNFGDFSYSNSAYEDSNWKTGEKLTAYEHFLDYAEGIYVGYRYYETRWVDNITGLCNEAAYKDVVQFPFGYGLSYTDFTQIISGFTTDQTNITMTVDVTNNGTAAGKDVVQVYYTAPYTPGGIEKSHVVLAEFGKTQVIAPGATETVTITFPIEDMASYDEKVNQAYVLDSGAYVIKLMNNAHEVIDSETYTVPSTVVYSGENKRASDDVAATNLFPYALGDVKYVSRADWEGTLPTVRTPDREASAELLAEVKNYDAAPDDTATDIVIKDNNLKLADLVGLAYEDPKWDLLLEQLSVADMQKLIGSGGYATQMIKSIGKPYTIDLDGPAGINALVNATAYAGVQYAAEILLASTWNQELAQEMGECYGDEANAWGVSGLYAPAMNIHRSPFSGRNFEYYSEDPTLSAKIAAKVVGGIQSKNVYCYIKHYALNDQETNRSSLCTWSNEQAMREIYLKPFELAVKEGHATAIMSSFNRIGATWAGASYELMTSVPRGEWGFRGMIITDYDASAFQSPNQGIRAGNDLMLSTLGDPPTDTSNAGKQAMRNASHNILYTVANSNAIAINNMGPTPYWLYALIALDVVVVGLEILFFLRWTKKNKAYSAATK